MRFMQGFPKPTVYSFAVNNFLFKVLSCVKKAAVLMVLSYHLQVLPEVCVDCVLILEFLQVCLQRDSDTLVMLFCAFVINDCDHINKIKDFV